MFPTYKCSFDKKFKKYYNFFKKKKNNKFHFITNFGLSNKLYVFTQVTAIALNLSWLFWESKFELCFTLQKHTFPSVANFTQNDNYIMVLVVFSNAKLDKTKERQHFSHKTASYATINFIL